MSNHGKFPYDPYKYVSESRRKELKIRAEMLYQEYKVVHAFTFAGVGDVLNDISEQPIYGVNTDEKATTWCLFVETFERLKPKMWWDGLKKENIDTWETGKRWGHIIVSFRDGRHGSTGGPDSYTDGTFNDALREIDAYERSIKGVHIGIRNEGDAAASTNIVKAMFAFRSGGFAAFARTWNQVFLGR
jgi:hypothetical protein